MLTSTPAGRSHPGNLTVGDLVDMWFEKGLPSRNLQPGSVASHDWARKIILEDIGHKRLKTLSPDDVEVMFRRRCDAGLSKSSLSKIRTTLRIALQWAERREIVFRNVATVSELPPDAASSPPLKSMTSEQVRAFLSASEGTHLDAMWRIMVFLGVRPGEAAGLSWDDVDFANQLIHIRRALKRGAWASCTSVFRRQCSRSAHSMHPTRCSTRSVRKRVQNVERLAAGEVWNNEEGLVFTTSVGTPTDPTKNRKAFDQVVKAAGLEPEWSPNSLRHTAASLLSDAGVPLEVVAEQLGHKDTRMASLHYRHRVRPTVSGGTTLGRLLADPESCRPRRRERYRAESILLAGPVRVGQEGGGDQRDPDMGLPGRFDWCVQSELSAGLPVPAWPAVAVLIRSLSMDRLLIRTATAGQAGTGNPADNSD